VEQNMATADHNARETASATTSWPLPAVLLLETDLPAGRSPRAGNPAEPDTPLGLYLHIPFCRKRCKFCYFRVYTDKNARDVETYIEAP